jgi:uroporphyrin-3 C-methyltransferase
MNTELPAPVTPEVVHVVPPAPATSARPAPAKGKRALRSVAILSLVAAVGLLASAWAWQKMNAQQQQLAQQIAVAVNQATQAQNTAKHSQEQVVELLAKLSVTQTKLAEVALQRAQLDELMQSLSRSRDENLVVDIESAVRLAQQQAQLTGSVEPLLATLKTAQIRLVRAGQVRLMPLQRAIARDIDRVKSTSMADTSALLLQIDEVVLLVDTLPLANAAKRLATVPAQAPQTTPDQGTWLQRWLQSLRDTTYGLVRVSRIEAPEAILLSPEQSFFLRENLKLKLLNARMALLSRQIAASRSDLAVASSALGRWFDASARPTVAAQGALQQVQSQMKSLEIPRLDATLAALSTAAAGR